MPPDTPGDIDVTRPSPARVYDYLLGGTDNYAVDRRTAEHVLAEQPRAREPAVANRRFLIRAVEYLCARGIRQFLDLGAGLPTAENTHQVAHRHAPGSHVVYVDNDPSVLAHARALLGEQDRTGYVHADVRDVDAVLNAAVTRGLLDLSRPVALLAVAVLHFIPDDDDPAGVMRRYIGQLAAGSFVVLSAATSTGLDAGMAPLIRETVKRNAFPLVLRPREAIEGMFGGAPLVEPGLVSVDDWPVPGGRPPLLNPLLGGVAQVA